MLFRSSCNFGTFQSGPVAKTPSAQCSGPGFHQHWEFEVLATRPPGKSPEYFLCLDYYAPLPPPGHLLETSPLQSGPKGSLNFLCYCLRSVPGYSCSLVLFLPHLAAMLLAWWLTLVQFSRSVVSDFLRPHESQHARPPCPSPTPGVHSNSCPSSQ